MRRLNKLINKKFTRCITGGQVIFNKFKEQNVTDVFIYSGGAIMPLVDTFYKSDINYYVNNN